jgi:16S rRNA (adenine1518-N6/adenine1519-N6)-dimethyltransferase
VNIYRPTELQAFLNAHNKKANKKLSQNFLIDKNILDKIISYNKSYKSFPVLEIGPGPGALTEQLLNQGFTVHAVDLDQEFVDLLKKRLIPFFPSFSVEFNDFLKLDLNKVFASSSLSTVIANLPYHISSKALIKLLIHSKYFAAITLMVQKEFYDRIQAIDGKDYGAINILARICATSIEGFKVSASCFYPAPRVDSAVLHMTLNCSHSPEKLEDFYSFLKTCFSSRRKKLISNLEARFDKGKLTIAFENFKLDQNTRVEEITPEIYFQLYSFLLA